MSVLMILWSKEAIEPLILVELLFSLSRFVVVYAGTFL